MWWDYMGYDMGYKMGTCQLSVNKPLGCLIITSRASLIDQSGFIKPGLTLLDMDRHGTSTVSRGNGSQLWHFLDLF